MKIAFVYDAVYPWIKGGAEKRIYELGRRLAARGNEVHIFGMKWWDGDAVLMQEGIMLHGVCRAGKLYVNSRRSITEALIFSINLPFHLLKEKYDLIDVCAFPYFSCLSARLVSIVRKRPMIITWLEVWDNYWYEYLGTAGVFGKLIEYLVSRLPERSLAISALTKQGLKKLGVDERTITVIPGGVDIKHIREIVPSDKKCDLLFAGRLIKEKNVDVLLKSVEYVKRTLPSVRCHVIGEGPENERLRSIASGLDLIDNVSFSGFLDYDEVISRIKSAGMLVVPSGREGFGMVVIEAYACGIPVITVREERNAAAELVDGTGFAVKLDPKDLGEVILMLLKDTGLRKRMSETALKKAQDYDWDIIVKQLSDLYKEMVRESRGAV